MKLFNKIILATIVGISLYSCSSNEEQFVGSWLYESEEEVMGLTFLPRKEILTLNEDKSFNQSFTYFDESQYDTVAIVSVIGNWVIANNCLEMCYDTTSVVVKCEDEDIKDIFFDDIMGNIKYNNDELKKAHNEDSQYGIQNAAVKDNKLISKENVEDEDGEEIYTKTQ